MERYEIPLSKKVVEHGLKLGKKVYIDKLSFSDKFRIGGANELQADIYGFIAESAVCEFFKAELPKFTPSELDEYDLILNKLKVDVKKVGFSRNTKRPKITLNKRQFARKKPRIDAFLFCTFKGMFQEQSAGIGRYQIFVPAPTFCDTSGNYLRNNTGLFIGGYLQLLGWIKTEEVEKSRTYKWRDARGNVKDESWLIKEIDLRPVEELVG